jgi:hypothetical protein
VRRAAALSLGGRKVDATSFAAQRQAFTSDTSDEVRVAVLSNLWAARSEFPETRAIVEAARGDASKAVREAAASLVD